MSNYNPYTKRQTMIAPDYEVYRYRSTYMNEVELHHHDFYEVYLLLRGRVEYIVENQLYRVRPGDWMLCSPLELHQARHCHRCRRLRAHRAVDRAAVFGEPVHPAHQPDPLL